MNVRWLRRGAWIGSIVLLSWLGAAEAQQDDGEPDAGATTPEVVPVRVEVDPSGGPLLLEEELQAAADAWRDAGIDTLELRIEEGAPHVVRYGDPERLGPDTVLLTLRRSDAEGLEVQVHPERLDEHPAALLRVVARLAGVNAAAEGLLDPALEADEPEVPSEADVERWREARSFAPADVDRDGTVDFQDLLAVAERYGERGVDLAADVDGSGVVDDADLRLLREAYTFTSPADEPASTSGSSDSDGR